jgi:hypothetical protein
MRNTVAAEASGDPELGERFRMKQLGAVCRGGIDFGSCYLHSSIGIAAKKNLDLLHKIAGVLRQLAGPWILAGDFNGTPEELEATGFLKLAGGKLQTQGGDLQSKVHRLLCCVGGFGARGGKGGGGRGCVVLTSCTCTPVFESQSQEGDGAGAQSAPVIRRGVAAWATYEADD